MVIRQGQALVPERRTVLRHGDDLLVVTPRKAREATEERLRQVSSGGRLAQWLGDAEAARTRALLAATGSRAGCRRWSASTAVTDSTSFLRSDLNDSPTTTTMPRPSSSPETILADLNWRRHEAHGRVAGLVAPDLDAVDLGWGVAAVGADEAALLELLHRRAGQAVAVAAVVDADRDLVAEDLRAGVDA